MQQDTGKRTLEGHKLFPYVAWVVTAGFAVFVYNITTDLQAVTKDLQEQTAALEAKIQHNDPEADFDAYNAQRYEPVSAATTE